MSPRDIAEAIRMQLADCGAAVTLRPVAYAPDLYDLDVASDGWTLTLSVAADPDSLRLILDDYVIDSISSSDAIEFVHRLIDGDAVVYVSRSKLFGKRVTLDVRVESGRHISVSRGYGPGLAAWEEQLRKPTPSG